jgi:hypothetical protein
MKKWKKKKHRLVELEVIQGHLLKHVRLLQERLDELEERDRNKTSVLTAHLTGHPGLNFDVYKTVKQ